MPILTFSRVETGFARIHYTEKREGKSAVYYCFQESFKGEFCFYRSSRDGEPSHCVPYDDLIGTLPLPPGKDPFTNTFTNWVMRERKNLQSIAQD